MITSALDDLTSSVVPHDYQMMTMLMTEFFICYAMLCFVLLIVNSMCVETSRYL
jgi:hypothetical protein